MGLSLGVDIGGTKVGAGLVDEEGTIVASARKKTPTAEPHAIAKLIGELARDLGEQGEIGSIGIGAAGLIDFDAGTVRFAPNLSWRHEPLAEQVQTETGIENVVLENDANAAAWGEFRFGAAKDASSAVVITFGTGIGGGIILDGRLLHGMNGFAAEIGHINLVSDGVECGCGQLGCWEQYSSGRALGRIARELCAARPKEATTLMDLANGKIAKIKGPLVTKAAMMGDVLALDAFATVGHWAGLGMADLAAILDPDMFVLAGGVSETGDILKTPVTEAFNKRLTARDFRTLPRIECAELGNKAGLIGAADLARTAGVA